MNDSSKPPRSGPPPRKPSPHGSKGGLSFPIIRPIIEGFHFVWRHKKMACSLAFFPVIVTLLMQHIILSYTDATPFRAAIIQLPAEFVLGLSCMIIVMHAMRDYQNKNTPAPAPADNVKPLNTQTKDRFLKAADIIPYGYGLRAPIIAYAFVSYILSGFFAGMVSLYQAAGIDIENIAQDLAENPESVEASANSMPVFLILALFVVLIWILRYLWLPIIIAMRRPIRGTFKKIGGMEGSVMIGVMFMIIIITTMLGLSIILSLVLPMLGISSTNDLSNIALYFRDILSTFAMIIAQFVFMAASVHALYGMDRKKKT